MKPIFTKAPILLMATCFLLHNSIFAQEKREKKERIVIEQKGGKKEKIVIEIDGDQIKVNGKPVDKNDSNLTIRKFKWDDDHDIVIEGFRSPRIKVLPFGSTEPYGGRHYQFKNHSDEWRRLSDEWRHRSGEMRERMKETKRNMENRAFLGVGTDEDKEGAKITEVQKESAAAGAGFKEGDIITKVGDTEINNPEQLTAAIRKQKPGDEVTINYLRDGKRKSAKVKLGSLKMTEDFDFEFELPELPELPKIDFEKQLQLEYLHPWNGDLFNGDLMWFHNRPRLGATIQDTEEGNGVKILEVDEGSVAAKSGLQSNDVITEINGKKITNVQEAREALREKKETSSWKIQALRDGKPVTVEVKIPKELKKTEL